jgi:hypothetical protein
MRRENWIWMPHAGHFILGERCQFRLNTYVGRFIVSTVGELWSDRQVREIHAQVYNPKWLMENQHLKGDEFNSAYMKKFGFEDIGADRKYETMVFRAEKSNNKCCPFKIIVSKEVDFRGYNNAVDATKGHYELCRKWSVK